MEDVEKDVFILPLSARSQKSLRELCCRLLSRLEAHPTDMWSMCMTMCIGRDHFENRLCFSGSKKDVIEDMQATLRSTLCGHNVNPVSTVERRKVVLLHRQEHNIATVFHNLSAIFDATYVSTLFDDLGIPKEMAPMPHNISQDVGSRMAQTIIVKRILKDIGVRCDGVILMEKGLEKEASCAFQSPDLAACVKLFLDHAVETKNDNCYFVQEEMKILQSIVGPDDGIPLESVVCISGVVEQTLDTLSTCSSWASPCGFMRSLSELYLAGFEVEWGKLSTMIGRPFQRMVLPTYPFDGKRCWFELDSAASSALRNVESSSHVYEEVWMVECEDFLGEVNVKGKKPEMEMVRLNALPGSEFVLKDCEADMKSFNSLDELQKGWVSICSVKGRHRALCVLVPLAMDASKSSLFDLSCAMFQSVIELVQYVTTSMPPHLELVVAVAVDENLCPIHPSLWRGLVSMSRSVNLEMGKRMFYTLSIMKKGVSTVEVGHILDWAVHHGSFNIELSLEGSIRTPRYQVVTIADDEKCSFSGSAVVIGGAGSLGILASRHLARCGCNEVILVSRRALSEEEKSRIRYQLQQDNLSGDSKVVTFRIAQANYDNLNELEKVCETSQGRISVVVDAAGVVFNESLKRIEWDNVEKMIYSKLIVGQNAIALGEKVHSEQVYLFSSLASFVGSSGQIGYSIANGLMDGLAEFSHRSQSSQCSVRSINWSAWNIGMGIQEDFRFEERGIRPLDAKTSAKWFDRGFRRCPQPILAVGDIVWSRFAQVHGITKWKVLEALLPVHSDHVRKQTPAGTRENKAWTRMEITKVVLNACIRIVGEDVAENDRLLDLGVDSLQAMELRNILCDELDMDLPTTLVFDYPSPDEIVSHVLASDKNEVGKGQSDSVEPLIRGYSHEDNVVVVGYACRFGGCTSAEELWSILEQKSSVTGTVPPERAMCISAGGEGRFGGFLSEVDMFDARFFDISPSEANMMDPQQRAVLEVVFEAVEGSGVRVDSLRGKGVGVFVGVANHDYGKIMQEKGVESVATYHTTGSLLSVLSGRIAHAFDFRGPAVSIDTACSSSLVAVHSACEAVASGQCEYALAGGVNIFFQPYPGDAMRGMQFMSKSGVCRAFDDRADGFVRAEGCGFVLLTRESVAKRMRHGIHGVIKGTALNHDGHASALTAPHGPSQEAVLRQALSIASLQPGDIDFIETHGTGTRIGDPIEVNAIKRVLSDGRTSPLVLGAIKSNIGHTETAAGIAGLIKILLCLKHEMIPGNVNFEVLNRNLPSLDSIPAIISSEHTPWKQGNGARARTAGVSSFGISGTNAHVIISEFIDKSRDISPLASSTSSDEMHVLKISAQSVDALIELVEEYTMFVKEQSPCFHDMCYTGNLLRSDWKYRIGLAFSSKAELLESLTHFPKKDANIAKSSISRDFVVLFGPIIKEHSMEDLLFLRETLGSNDSLQAMEAAFTSVTGGKLQDSLSDHVVWNVKACIKVVFDVLSALVYEKIGLSGVAVSGVGIGSISSLLFAGALSPFDALHLAYNATREIGCVMGVADDFEVSSSKVQSLCRLGDVSLQGEDQDDVSFKIGTYGILEQWKLVHLGTLHRSLIRLCDGRILAPGSTPAVDDVLCHGSVDMGPIFRNVRDRGSLLLVDGSSLIGALAHLDNSDDLRPIFSIESSRENESVRSTMMRNVVRLYECGISVAWELFYKSGNSVDCLPIHPLLRQSYWFEKLHHKSAFQKILHMVDSSSASRDKTAFRAMIDVTRFPFLSDHVIQTRAILPASAFVEIAICAHTLVCKSDSRAYSLRSLSFLNALDLNAGPKMIDVLVDRTRHDRSRIEIFEVSANDHVLLFATTVLVDHSVHGDAVGQIVGLASLHVEQTRLSKDVMYKKFEQSDIHYGHAFQVVNGVFSTPDERLFGRLSVPGDVQKDRFIVHPSLLDGCFQLLSTETFMSEVEDKGTFVPAKMGSLDVIQLPIHLDRDCTCEVRVKKIASGNRIGGDLILYSGDQPCLVVHDMVLQHVEKFSIGVNSMLSATETKDHIENVYVTEWIESPMEDEEADDLPTREPLGKVFLLKSDNEGIDVELEESGVERVDLIEENVRDVMALDETRLKTIVAKSVEIGGTGIFVIHLGGQWVDHVNPEAVIQTVAFVAAVARSMVLAHSSMRFVLLLQQRLAVGTEFSAPHQSPLVSSLSGFVRALSVEEPWMHPLVIVVEGKMNRKCVRDMFQSKETIVAYKFRNGELSRKVCRLLPFRSDQRMLESSLQREKLENPHVLSANATYIIFGGGGIGGVLARDLLRKGAGAVVLCSRSGKRPADIPSDEVRLHVRSVDVTKAEEVVELIRHVQEVEHLPTIKGIYHLAAILRDGPLKGHDVASFSAPLRPKIVGAWNIHQATLECSLDLFVLFSGAASILGSPMQTNYAAANGYLDGFVHYRRNLGLPCTCINWGAWGEIGMAASDELRARFRRAGVTPMKSDFALDGMDRIIALGVSQATFLQLSWREYLQTVPDGSRSIFEKIENTLPKEKELVGHHAGDVAKDGKKRSIKKQTPFQIREAVISTVKRVLGVEDEEDEGSEKTLGLTVPLFDLGFDSLMAVELSNVLSKAFDIEFAPTILFDFPTIEDLVKHVASNSIQDDSEDEKQPATEIVHMEEEQGLSREPIAIIGYAGRFAQSSNVEEFWENILAGRDCTTEAPKSRYTSHVDKLWREWNVETSTNRGGFLKDVYSFDHPFFGLTVQEALTMDPQQRLLLEVAWEALESASVDFTLLKGSKTGVFVGASSYDYAFLMRDRGYHKSSPFFTTGTQFSVFSGRIAYLLGVNGPAMTVDTACSSSLVAIHTAILNMREGMCDMALAGGINLVLTPDGHIGLSKMHALSPDGQCKTFDESANGFARAEGVGMVVLKPLSRAVREGDHIIGLVLGTAVNQDGQSSALTAPSGRAQQDVIETALRKAKVSPKDVTYVETHGTGTELGDPIELASLKNVFGAGRSEPVILGAVKSNVGHAEAGAGMASVVKVLRCIETKKIPPNIHLKTLNPKLPLLESIPAILPDHVMEWEPSRQDRRIATIQGFGIAGTNACVVLSEYIPQKELTGESVGEMRKSIEKSPGILTVSGRNRQGVLRMMDLHLRNLKKSKECVQDVCYTSNVGRRHLGWRMFGVGVEKEEVLSSLAGYDLPEALPRSNSLLFLDDFLLLQSDQDMLSRMPKLDYFVDKFRRKFIVGESIPEFLVNWVGVASVAYAMTSLIHRLDISIILATQGEWELPVLCGLEVIEIDDLASHFIQSYGGGNAVIISIDFTKLRNPFMSAVHKRLLQPSGESQLEYPLSLEELCVCRLDQQDVQVRAPKGDVILVSECLKERYPMEHLLGGLYVRGVEIDWPAYHEGSDLKKVVIPTYSFEKIRLSVLDEIPLPVTGTKNAVTLKDGERILEIEMVDIFTKFMESSLPSLPSTFYLLPMTLSAVDVGMGNDGELHAIQNVQIRDIESSSLSSRLRHHRDDRIQLVTRQQDSNSTMSIVNAEERSFMQCLAFSHESIEGVDAPPLHPDVVRTLREHTLDEGSVVRKSSSMRFFDANRIPMDGETYFVVNHGFLPAEDICMMMELCLAHEIYGEIISDAKICDIKSMKWSSVGHSDQVVIQTSVSGMTVTAFSLKNGQPLVKMEGLEMDREGNHPSLLTIGWEKQVFEQTPPSMLVPVNALVIYTHTIGSLTRGLLKAIGSISHVPIWIRTSEKGDGLETVDVGDIERIPKLLPKSETEWKNVLPSSSVGLVVLMEEESIDGFDVHAESGLVEISERLNEMSLFCVKMCAYVSSCRIVAPVSVRSWELHGLLRGFALGSIREMPSGQLTLLRMDMTDVFASASILLGELSVSSPDLFVEVVGGVRKVGKVHSSDLLERNIVSDAKAQWSCGLGSYLITGGFGGLGLIVAESLAEHGCKGLVLVGRKNRASEDGVRQKIEKLRQRGVAVFPIAADISDLHSVTDMFSRLSREGLIIEGIFHCAGVVKDSLLQSMDVASWKDVLSPKVVGSWNLHIATKDLPSVQRFVLFSSITGTLPSDGQTNYACANGYLDEFARYRQSLGLPVLSIGWGPWAGDGMFERLTEAQKAQSERNVSPLSKEVALHIMHALLAPGNKESHVSVVALRGPFFREMSSLAQAASYVARIMPERIESEESALAFEMSATLLELVRAEDDDSVTELIAENLKNTLCTYLGVEMSEIEDDMPFNEMGVESLAAVELRASLAETYHIELPTSLIYNYPTVSKMCVYLRECVMKTEWWATALTDQEQDGRLEESEVFGKTRPVEPQPREKSLSSTVPAKTDVQTTVPVALQSLSFYLAGIASVSEVDENGGLESEIATQLIKMCFMNGNIELSRVRDRSVGLAVIQTDKDNPAWVSSFEGSLKEMKIIPSNVVVQRMSQHCPNVEQSIALIMRLSDASRNDIVISVTQQSTSTIMVAVLMAPAMKDIPLNNLCEISLRHVLAESYKLVADENVSLSEVLKHLTVLKRPIEFVVREFNEDDDDEIDQDKDGEDDKRMKMKMKKCLQLIPPLNSTHRHVSDGEGEIVCALSAPTAELLAGYRDVVVELLKSKMDEDFKEFVPIAGMFAALRLCRPHFSHRIAFVSGSGRDDILCCLTSEEAVHCDDQATATYLVGMSANMMSEATALEIAALEPEAMSVLKEMETLCVELFGGWSLMHALRDGVFRAREHRFSSSFALIALHTLLVKKMFSEESRRSVFCGVMGGEYIVLWLFGKISLRIALERFVGLSFSWEDGAVNPDFPLSEFHLHDRGWNVRDGFMLESHIKLDGSYFENIESQLVGRLPENDDLDDEIRPSIVQKIVSCDIVSSYSKLEDDGGHLLCGIGVDDEIDPYETSLDIGAMSPSEISVLMFMHGWNVEWKHMLRDGQDEATAYAPVMSFHVGLESPSRTFTEGVEKKVSVREQEVCEMIRDRLEIVPPLDATGVGLETNISSLMRRHFKCRSGKLIASVPRANVELLDVSLDGGSLVFGKCHQVILDDMARDVDEHDDVSTDMIVIPNSPNATDNPLNALSNWNWSCKFERNLVIGVWNRNGDCPLHFHSDTIRTEVFDWRISDAHDGEPFVDVQPDKEQLCAILVYAAEFLDEWDVFLTKLVQASCWAKRNGVVLCVDFSSAFWQLILSVEEAVKEKISVFSCRDPAGPLYPCTLIQCLIPGLMSPPSVSGVGVATCPATMTAVNSMIRHMHEESITSPLQRLARRCDMVIDEWNEWLRSTRRDSANPLRLSRAGSMLALSSKSDDTQILHQIVLEMVSHGVLLGCIEESNRRNERIACIFLSVHHKPSDIRSLLDALKFCFVRHVRIVPE
eukprot:TRINITY_DN1637_c0_g1_i1.p1 TRINITY_DN1637_c0_g1~~TRINITY_DN1637_c0_g1_i1.p1  ORF type:complete len:5817 (-),score=1557.98 TRINITY_DN1637_c0_g1_i1:84-16049(-)